MGEDNKVHYEPLQNLTEEFAMCMRRNNVKRASGRWDEYERAKKIALAEINTKFKNELLERAYLWVLPKGDNG